jgi:hypothetical protein
MKKRVTFMQKYSKEEIMVSKNQRRMSIIEIHIQQDLPHSGGKEASTIMKRSTEENIMISQGRNSEGIQNKEDYSLLGMEISFMAILFVVLTLEIRLQIAGLMKEIFKQENFIWPHMTLNVTSAITMDT